MKIIQIIIFLALISTIVQGNLTAQVSINTDNSNPDASAMLDVKSTDKGLLIPRMTSAQRTAIVNPAIGLLVFDHTTGSFWFYNGSAWIDLSESPAPDHITDADYDTKIQVEESNDEDIIRFDIGGKEALRISKSPGGKIMLELPSGDVDNSTFVGHGAGASSTTGINNTFIGKNAGMSTTSGFTNTFVGYAAGEKNKSGGGNVSIGTFAGNSNTNGIGNTNVGHNAGLDNTTGQRNTNLGLHAGANNINGDSNTNVGNQAGQNNPGSENVMLGSYAGQHSNGSGNIFIGYSSGINETGSNKLYIANSNTSSPLIYGEFDNDIVAINGNLGIGTDDPTKGIVEISGFVNQTFSYGYLNSSGNTDTSSGQGSYSLYASDRIAAIEFNAHSDQRIKNIKGISDSQQDLQTLMGIEITDYTLIDTIENGSNPYKKVIAQQLAYVYPQAVTTNLTETIPDIYQQAEVNEGWIELATNLQTGEKVKIITENSAKDYEVLEVEATRFKVSSLATDISKVFVYGREVSDFHTVDYEAVAMLNVSATQELVKQMEQLKSENEQLKAQNNEFEARFAKIEAALQNTSRVKLPVLLTNITK